MADQTSGSRNWQLLLLACGLGIVVMVIYNLHIAQIKKASQGREVTVYVYANDLDPGDRIGGKSLAKKRIPYEYVERLGNLATEKDVDSFAANTVKERVVKGWFARWEHVSESASGGLGLKFPPGHVAVVVPLNGRIQPGKVLRIGGWVNLIGRFSPDGRVSKMYRIIEGLRVAGIGGEDGRLVSNRGSRGAKTRIRSYSSICVFMPKAVSLQWGNLKTHLQRGQAEIEVVSASEVSGNASRINPKLAGLASQAGTRSGSTE